MIYEHEVIFNKIIISIFVIASIFGILYLFFNPPEFESTYYKGTVLNNVYYGRSAGSYNLCSVKLESGDVVQAACEPYHFPNKEYRVMKMQKKPISDKSVGSYGVIDY